MRAIILTYFYWVTFSVFALTMVMAKGERKFRVPSEQETTYSVAFGYLMAATLIHFNVIPV